MAFACGFSLAVGLLSVFASTLVTAAPQTLVPLSIKYGGMGSFNSKDFAAQGHCSLGTTKALNLPWRAGVRSVALSSTQYGSSNVCGLCIAYRGTKKGSPFKQTWSYGIVVDDCPRCKDNDIVVYNSGSGYHPIEWQAVQCNVQNTPLQYSFQGGNDYYFKLAISNTRVPVKAVQLRLSPKKSAKLVRTTDNFWEYNPMGRKIKYPLTFRITSYTGDSLEETLHISSPVGIIRGKKQFPLKKPFSSVP